MNTTKSFNINVIRDAVDRFQSKHGGFGDVTVTPSHFDSKSYEAMGYAQSELDGVIMEVGRLAEGIEAERQDRLARQEALRQQFETGVLTYEQWQHEYQFSF